MNYKVKIGRVIVGVCESVRVNCENKIYSWSSTVMG